MDEETGAGVFVRLVHGNDAAAATLERHATESNVVLCHKSSTLRSASSRRTRRRPGPASASPPYKQYSFSNVFTRADSTITVYEQCLHPLVIAAVESRYDGLFAELMSSRNSPDRHVLLNYTTKIVLESLKSQLCARGTFRLDENSKFQTSQARLQQRSMGVVEGKTTSSFVVTPEKNRRYSVFFSQVEIGNGEEVHDMLEPRTAKNKHINHNPIIKSGIVKGARSEEITDVGDLSELLSKTNSSPSRDVVSMLRIVSIDRTTKELEQCHLSFIQLASPNVSKCVPMFQKALEARSKGVRYAVPTGLGTTVALMRPYLDGRGQIALLVNVDTAPDDLDSIAGMLCVLSSEGTGMKSVTATATSGNGVGVSEAKEGHTVAPIGQEPSAPRQPDAPSSAAPVMPTAYNSVYPPLEHLTIQTQSVSIVKNAFEKELEGTSSCMPSRRNIPKSRTDEDLKEVDNFLTMEEIRIRAEERAMEQEVHRIKQKQDLLNIAKLDREKKIISHTMEEIKILKREIAEQHKVVGKMSGDIGTLTAENASLKDKLLRSGDRVRTLESEVQTSKEMRENDVEELTKEHELYITTLNLKHKEEIRLRLHERDKKLDGEKNVWLQEVEAGVTEQLRYIQQQLHREQDEKARLMRMVQDLARCVSSEEQAKTALELVSSMQHPSPRRARNGKSIYLRGHNRVLSHANQQELGPDTESVFGPKLQRNAMHTSTPQKNQVKKSDLYLLANRTEKDGVVVTQLFKGDVVKSVSGKGRSVYFTGMEEHSETLPIRKPTMPAYDKTDLIVFAQSDKTKGSMLVSNAQEDVARETENTRKRPVEIGDESDEEAEEEARALLGETAYEKLRRQRLCGIQIEGQMQHKTARSVRQISGETRRKYTKLA